MTSGVDVAAFEAALRQLIETPVGDLPGRRLVKEESPVPEGYVLEVDVDDRKQYVPASELAGVKQVSFWVEPRAVAAERSAAFDAVGGTASGDAVVVGNAGAKVEIGKGQGVLGHLLADKSK